MHAEKEKRPVKLRVAVTAFGNERQACWASTLVLGPVVSASMEIATVAQARYGIKCMITSLFVVPPATEDACKHRRLTDPWVAPIEGPPTQLPRHACACLCGTNTRV